MTPSILKASILGTVLGLLCGPALAAPMTWESDFGEEVSALTGEDDERVEVDLSFDFPFEGADYTSVYIGVNGGLQLGSAGDDDGIDYDVWQYFNEFNDDAAPTIFPFNTDIDLASGGTIHFNDFGDRAVFTWNEVGTFVQEGHLSTFQVQLLDNGVIVFGYNGILDGADEDPLTSLDEGILIGISGSDGTDAGGSDLSSGPFSTTANTVYELWCYVEADSCDGGRPGPINAEFDLDQMNVIFTPQADGGFAVSNVDVAVP